MIRALFFLSLESPLSFPSILAVGEVALREMHAPTARGLYCFSICHRSLAGDRVHHLPLAFHVFQVLLLHQFVPRPSPVRVCFLFFCMPVGLGLAFRL